MKKSRFSEPQIMSILRQAESGTSVAELCWVHGMSTALFYRWRSMYCGMVSSRIAQMKALEDENTKLKRMLADSMLDNVALKDLLGKKW